jgi:hypothetical protein
MIPILLSLALEQRFVKALLTSLEMLLRLSPFFFVFQVREMMMMMMMMMILLLLLLLLLIIIIIIIIIIVIVIIIIIIIPLILLLLVLLLLSLIPALASSYNSVLLNGNPEYLMMFIMIIIMSIFMILTMILIIRSSSLSCDAWSDRHDGVVVQLGAAERQPRVPGHGPRLRHYALRVRRHLPQVRTDVCRALPDFFGGVCRGFRT